MILKNLAGYITTGDLIMNSQEYNEIIATRDRIEKRIDRIVELFERMFPKPPTVEEERQREREVLKDIEESTKHWSKILNSRDL